MLLKTRLGNNIEKRKALSDTDKKHALCCFTVICYYIIRYDNDGAHLGAHLRILAHPHLKFGCSLADKSFIYRQILVLQGVLLVVNK